MLLIEIVLRLDLVGEGVTGHPFLMSAFLCVYLSLRR